MFRITVLELPATQERGTNAAEDGTIKRGEYLVDSLDIGRLAAFLYAKPRKRRAAKDKST